MSKIQRNIERDAEIDEALGELGWHALRIWESDIRADTDRVAGEIEGIVHRYGTAL